MTSLCPNPTVTFHSPSSSPSQQRRTQLVPHPPGNFSGILNTLSFSVPLQGPLSLPISPLLRRAGSWGFFPQESLVYSQDSNPAHAPTIPTDLSTSWSSPVLPTQGPLSVNISMQGVLPLNTAMMHPTTPQTYSSQIPASPTTATPSTHLLRTKLLTPTFNLSANPIRSTFKISQNLTMFPSQWLSWSAPPSPT